MDPAHIFRQGLGSVPPRQNQGYAAQPQKPRQAHDDLSDDDGSGQRVAHTLTACCRCRQRKTRCDPTLPRCLPCERSGSTCEYLDATKGKKINRYYVIKLQDRVRALEAELGQYTDDESDYPRTNEDIVRPGGMIRLKASDETPRYLGPSSGIAMTRLLMEEAKRFTESHRISELIPEVRARSQARMQSIQMTSPIGGRKKSYPMVSQHPAESLPKRETVGKLVEVYRLQSQLYWPVLHEKDFERDLEAVYNGDSDPYRNFVVRMVIAISLQKLEIQYAGLADSYYVAAMRYVEAVIRPKGLKTLQCLILLGQYSLQTPTRTPVYYVVGLATRICQQEGLTDEQTITTGYNLDPQTIDMRRRLVWIVATMEFNLSYLMGRPSGFATGDDRMDVGFFATVDDEHISPNGIQSAPPSERKLAAIHTYRARQFQAEIRRVLYEKKKAEPKNDLHPWYSNIDKRMSDWLGASPESPQWFRNCFTSSYHQMRTVLYRPSPQVPQPSPRAANICFESSAFVLQQSQKQVEGGNVSITWVFLLALNSALNALLWATSYQEVRQAHPREEVEDLVNLSLLCLDRCVERWPATAYTSELYGIISRACLQSYEARGADNQRSGFSFASPPSVPEPQSPPGSHAQPVNSQQQDPFLNAPQFGFVFDSAPESVSAYPFDPNFPPQPTFRSNSIFCNPGTDSNGRRFSYFPPDSMQSGDGAPEDSGPSTVSPNQTLPSPSDCNPNQLPTPPESVPTGPVCTATPSTTLSPPGMPQQAPSMSGASADPGGIPVQTNMSPPQKFMPSQMHAAQVVPDFTSSRPPNSGPQRPLPVTTSSAEWFPPHAPFLSPYNFGPMSGNFFNDAMPNNFAESPGAGLGLQNMGAGLEAVGPFSYVPPGRQGSLTHSQQMELMNVLETEGVGDIDAFLNAGNIMADARWY
ncbi:Transcriptional activator protein acu-15 [Tolypocladium capitatum]|uniref:Transcriptional activator protein acu-15 n=1 Tax=Tolypocladium capitatum TaxID=45235 RepID=A0A2K3QFM3_9HYPO|nr:Transcriptional activator protein acu-15 [Tolypocladium capitatum]